MIKLNKSGLELIFQTKRNIQWSEQELLNSVNKYRLNSKEGEIKQKKLFENK